MNYEGEEIFISTRFYIPYNKHHFVHLNDCFNHNSICIHLIKTETTTFIK